jgi:signal transduction histidine kinase
MMKLLPIANESISLMVEPAKNKGIDLTCHISDEISVFADNNMLQTVIRNLISNALKFTPKGGTVHLSAEVDESKTVKISVQDTGIGMNPDRIDKLFRLDVQTNRKGTNGEPSSGLGLLLCKEFVEKHGGSIHIESEEGKGSTFSFTLPYSASSK